MLPEATGLQRPIPPPSSDPSLTEETGALAQEASPFPAYRRQKSLTCQGSPPARCYGEGELLRRLRRLKRTPQGFPGHRPREGSRRPREQRAHGSAGHRASSGREPRRRKRDQARLCGFEATATFCGRSTTRLASLVRNDTASRGRPPRHGQRHGHAGRGTGSGSGAISPL